MTEPERIQNKLADTITESGWRNKLKSFVMSQDFLNILEELIKYKNEGIRFTPPIKDIFRCFSECPFDKLQVVFLGDSPYAHFTKDDKNIADGIAFSHKFIGEDYMKQENRKLRFAAGDESTKTDLSRWANQGVLLLNSSLTTTVTSNKGHLKLWQPFIAFIMDMLNGHDNLIFVFVGNNAKNYSELIDDRHCKLFTPYPDYNWDEAKNSVLFEEIDKNLKTPIQWKE